MKKLLLILFLLTASITLNAQEVGYNKIKREYESFEYEKVIELSNELIKTGLIPDALLIDIYLMRAVAFYTIGNENSARNNFREILKINKNYSPDPSQISPKLISLFGEIKSEYLKSIEPEITKRDSTQTSQTVKVFDNSLLQGSLMRNIVLPGWGQIYSVVSAKGIILSTAATANLAAMIYYIVTTNKKENEYLIETNKNLIRQKYYEYNKSYKIKNALIVTYAILWLYSQLDLLFFTEENVFLKDPTNIGTINFNGQTKSLQLSLRVPF